MYWKAMERNSAKSTSEEKSDIKIRYWPQCLFT